MSPQHIQFALRHLRAGDRIMRGQIDEVGPFALRLERNRFRMLVRSIVSQQISTGAARSIRLRLEKLIAPAAVSPARIAQLDTRKLREAGLSSQKAEYILGLAGKVNQGQVRLRNVGRMDDEQVIAELTQVKGIGRWTAQMFLIFSLGRLDVLPTEDLGIRTAIRNLYQLDQLPDKGTCETIARPWRPYATVASWYCWRSLDQSNARKRGANGYPS